MTKDKARASPPDPTVPEGWKAIHREHGRGGPFYDCHIGIWHIWRCPCGQKFHFTEEQREQHPTRYMLDE